MRLDKSTNKHLLVDQGEKLDLVEQISTAVRDLASIIGGSKATAVGDIVDKAAACDDAGIELSGFVRGELLRARIDLAVQHCQYLDIANIMTYGSKEMDQLKEAEMPDIKITDLCTDILETISIGMLAMIPEEVSGKQAAKQKEEVASFFDIIITKCSDEKFMAARFKEQAEVAFVSCCVALCVCLEPSRTVQKRFSLWGPDPYHKTLLLLRSISIAWLAWPHFQDSP